MKKNRINTIKPLYIIIGLLTFLFVLLGSIYLSWKASKDTEKAVRKVSLLYLDELSGRREQVVENNLKSMFDDMRVAIDLMTAEDKSDVEHLQDYQARMKKLYKLEKFAFVDTNGLIYTALGPQENISDYSFDYKIIDNPEISILNLKTTDKKVILAYPIDIPFNGDTLKVCFMEKDMDELLSGVSMEAAKNGTTFCNIYTHDGVALTDTILGGLAVEDNLLDAMKTAEYEDGYSYEAFKEQFEKGERGVVSFT